MNQPSLGRQVIEVAREVISQTVGAKGAERNQQEALDRRLRGF